MMKITHCCNHNTNISVDSLEIDEKYLKFEKFLISKDIKTNISTEYIESQYYSPYGEDGRIIEKRILTPITSIKINLKKYFSL